MRYTRFATFLFFAALAAVGLSACDFSEQNYDIEPGDELEIRNASGFGDQIPNDEDDPSTFGFQRFVPDGASSFYIIPFTIDKEYTWSVEGPGDVSPSTRRGGEYMDVTFDEPGDYTVSIESVGQGEEYSGSFDVQTVYPDVGTQAGRFGALISAFGAGSLADSLAEDGNAPYTVLSPTSEALAAAFGETDDGDPDLPTTAILWDLVQYHVLVDEVGSGQLAGTQTTLVGVEADLSGVEPQRGDIPATNGLVHTIDQVLEPPFAMVDFLDQSAGIAEDAPADTTVTVASVYLPNGGYVVIEDGDGNPVSAVSDNLTGFNNDVTLVLDDGVELTGEGEFSAAVYQDSGLNTPYTRDGEDVADAGVVGPPAE